jgi:tetratricopeptide (TPR) repeat protein
LNASHTTQPGFELKARLTDGQVNTLYTQAYNLGRSGRHEDAGRLMLLITLYRPQEPKYSHALGVCLRNMGRYEEAVRAFARTMELRPREFGPAFQLIECMLHLGGHQEALLLLDDIAEVADDIGDTASHAQATELIKRLEETPA